LYEPFNKTVINDIITAGKAILFTDKFCIINAFLVGVVAILSGIISRSGASERSRNSFLTIRSRL